MIRCYPQALAYLPPPPPSFLHSRRTINVTVRQSLKKRASSLVWALHQSHEIPNKTMVVGGDRWVLSSKMSHTEEKKKKKKGASGSSVDPPPDSLAILTFWRPSDHWVSSGFVGPNRSQPYALSAPHYYLLPLNGRPGSCSRNAAGDNAGSDAASRQIKRAGSPGSRLVKPSPQPSPSRATVQRHPKCHCGLRMTIDDMLTGPQKVKYGRYDLQLPTLRRSIEDQNSKMQDALP